MAGRKTIRAELEEQRCLIERQQVELLRQKHHIEMQRRRMAHLEAELDAIKVISQRAASSTQQSPSNGKGRRPGHVSNETISSSDQA